jgi:hypothetical protein
VREGNDGHYENKNKKRRIIRCGEANKNKERQNGLGGGGVRPDRIKKSSKK